jgi:hypothetical protein
MAEEGSGIPIADILRAANELVSAGLIKNYALGGEVAAIYYTEPFTTYDADIILIPADQTLSAGIPAIYSHLRSKGWRIELWLDNSGERARLGCWRLRKPSRVANFLPGFLHRRFSLKQRQGDHTHHREANQKLDATSRLRVLYGENVRNQKSEVQTSNIRTSNVSGRLPGETE